MPTPPPEVLLSFQNVSLEREGRVVLDRVSLDVAAGEIVALIGPSGAGKTTMFKIALGFLRPTAGEVWVGGREISALTEDDLTAVRANEGIVFQAGALFTSMDVAENVAYGLTETGLSQDEIDRRVHTTLAAVGLDELADRMPDELSGGQAQRVAVARAIISEPRIMLYDEPTQGLDPRRGLDVTDEIVRLSRTGVASLVVTHQLEYARQYAHRVALLENGRIVYAGPVDGLRTLDDAFARSFFDLLEAGNGTSLRSPQPHAGATP